MKKFTVIAKDGIKWLRPVNHHPKKLPSHIAPGAFYFNSEWQLFENNNPDVIYIGSRPEGTTLDEGEVKEVRQSYNLILKGWQEMSPHDWACNIRTVYTDAESHNLYVFDEILNNTSDDAKMNVSLQMDLNYWKRRCEAAEGLLNAEAEFEHNLITAEEYGVIKEEWQEIIKQEPK